MRRLTAVLLLAASASVLSCSERGDYWTRTGGGTASGDWGALLGMIFLAILLIGVIVAVFRGASRKRKSDAPAPLPRDQNEKLRADLGVGTYGSGLILYDENGKIRADLSAFSKDGPWLGLSDKNGQLCATLSTTKDGPGLTWFPGNGNRVPMGAIKDGAMTRAERLEKVERELAELRAGLAKRVETHEIAVLDEKGMPRATLFASKELIAELRQLDPTRVSRAVLTALKDGPVLALYQGNGQLRAWVSVDKDAPRLTLFDEKGKFRPILDVDKEKERLLLPDEKGQIRVFLLTDEGGPGLTLWDEDGRPSWSDPMYPSGKAHSA